MDLFQRYSQDQETNSAQPLAERLRPKSLNEFLGQTKWASTNSPLIKNLREKKYLPNLILWGPPGTGKTTFAYLLSRETSGHFESCNAIDTGAKELRNLGSMARDKRLQFNEKTILFIDEIHRLNKSQQDVLLPFTEKGDLILVGATTENPSYELNSALLSRAQVLVFEKLENTDLEQILIRAAATYKINLSDVFSSDAKDTFISAAFGDARQLLNSFEVLLHLFRDNNIELNGDVESYGFPLTVDGLGQLNLSNRLRYDKKSDEHYNVISAFIKSVRGSDPDAAVYYLARMLEGGEDPVFIARRLVILASEDIGNADPKGLPLAVAGLQAVELIGLPEARINLAQVTTYLASAPKSNRAYQSINRAQEFVKKTGALPVPKSLRSAQTKLTKSLGYGVDYKYSHDAPKGYIEQSFLPEEANNEKFYEPTDHGFEKNIKQYLEWLKK